MALFILGYSTQCGPKWVAGSHESLEDPPQCPLFGAKRSHGQSNNLAVTLSDLAVKLVNAVSPQTSTNPNPNSPTKLVDPWGKYLQQLKEIVHLRDIGALTAAEYEEHRAVVNLLRNLSSNWSQGTVELWTDKTVHLVWYCDCYNKVRKCILNVVCNEHSLPEW